MDKTEAKINIELNFVGDGRIFLNYWDSIHAKDVCVEFKDNKLIHKYDDENETEISEIISLNGFIEKVEKSYLETQQCPNCGSSDTRYLVSNATKECRDCLHLFH